MADTLADLFQSAEAPEAYARAFCARMAEVVKSLSSEAVAKLIGAVEKACLEDRTIFVVGNGGSAAVAGHWVNDLSANSVVEGVPGFRVMSLADNAFSITALANDASFEEIFSIQLRASMRAGDLVILLSVSGNSPNILRAVEYANENGGYTVGCSGFDGGKLKELCHHSIHIPTSKDEYGPVEDVFGVIMHIVTGYLTMKRGRMLSH